MDDDEKALAELPTLADRMAYHTKRLRIIQYAAGAEGVASYKAKHPEAKSIRVKASMIAFQPKPEGYSDFLCGLVDSWLTSDTALAETNRADVERLNRAMHPRRFNPDNHFSKPLSGTLLGRLADVFAKHGYHLDTSKTLSMAKVRASAKAAKGERSLGRPFASIGHIADDQLAVGDQSFRIEKHNGHDCIRISVNGTRVRLRLDALAEFVALAGLGQSLSLSSSYGIRIGELAPDPENGPEADPLANILSENRPQELPLLKGELAPDFRSLSERIAALKPMQAQHSTTDTDGPDPLAL